MKVWIVLVVALSAAACASAPAPPPCALPEADRAWLDQAVEAWRFTSREITGIERMPRTEAIFFGADCVLRSENAFGRKNVIWTASTHGDTVALPNGSAIPVGVTSFASVDEKKQPFFVMSTPSVWQAGGVGEGESLRTLMIAVMLHETSHVVQTRIFGDRLGALIDRYHLPDSFNDDSVQDRFKSNPEFAESVKQETQLFLEAAAASDVAEARALARKARRLMRERQTRWFVGDDAYFTEAEDIWLTFEGAGQWTGYQWLVHPRGGGRPKAELMARFSKDRHWSQGEGFAIVMALERITGPSWKRHAFDGAQTVLEMLDMALTGAP